MAKKQAQTQGERIGTARLGSMSVTIWKNAKGTSVNIRKGVKNGDTWDNHNITLFGSEACRFIGKQLMLCADYLDTHGQQTQTESEVPSLESLVS